MTFTARGEQTELTMRMAFASAEALQYVVEKYHAIEGGTQTLARFESYLQMQVRAAAMPELPSLTLTRVFKAPQALVFKAWTDAEHLKHCWGPRMFTTARCELDLRVGGAFVIHMKAPNGTIYPMTGTVREVVEPERFAYDFMVPDLNGAPLFEGRTTASFRAVGDTTELTMRTEITSKAEGANQFLKGMEIGWNQSLDRLGEFVETGRVSN